VAGSLRLGFVWLVRILAVTAIAVGLAPAAALATFPGGNGVIAYSHEGAIWAVEPHTRNQLEITSGPGDSEPSFSPSGNLLAFQRFAAGTFTVYLANADGSDARPLVKGSQPAFSPNGQQIVFVRAGGLFLTGLAPGGPVRQITDHPGDHWPQWGANGSIVFQRTDIWHQIVTCIINGGSNNITEMLLERGARYCKNNHVTHEDMILRRSDLDISTPPSWHVRQILTYQAQLSTQHPSSETAQMYPNWSPNSEAISAALCLLDSLGGPGPVLRSAPSIIFHESCSPAVWAPAGRRPIVPNELNNAASLELVAPPRPGRAFTQCPYTIEGVFAWQPLVEGTMRVPTVQCEERPNSPGEAQSAAVSPGEVVSGGHLCTYLPRRHRKICTKT
jgi:hypothetical protein